MTAPLRIQRKRVKGWRMPPGTVYVGRPSRWGNPYRTRPAIVGEKFPPLTHANTVDLFACLWRNRMIPGQENDAFRAEIESLRGKNLACWCKLCPAHAGGKPVGVHCPDCEPCHADVLLKIAND